MGIEPTISRWQREVLPLNYADNFTAETFKPLLVTIAISNNGLISLGVLWFRASSDLYTILQISLG